MDEQRIREIVREEIEAALESGAVMSKLTVHPLGDSLNGLCIDGQSIKEPNTQP